MNDLVEANAPLNLDSYFTSITGLGSDGIEEIKKSVGRATKSAVLDAGHIDRVIRGNKHLVAWPYDVYWLKEKTHDNNTLLQCIDAIAVNVASTGHTLVRKDGEQLDTEDPDYIAALNFTDEPYTRKTLKEIAECLVEDLESSGSAYLEIVRNGVGEAIMCNSVDTETMWLVDYDDHQPSSITILRNGQEVTFDHPRQFRRYYQKVGDGGKYFKEPGAPELNADTGEWEAEPPLGKRANEVIHLRLRKDHATPYGVPSWINQLPSIVGSRRAEIENLSYLDNSGVPPVIIFVSGGSTVGGETKQEIQNEMHNAKPGRAAVVQLLSTSGSLDKEGKIEIKVERFGSENMKDAMYQEFDVKSREKVRSSFRLPPIFIGLAEDYSHATALASRIVAEYQVFGPKRTMLEDAFNMVLQAHGITDHRLVLNPTSFSSVDTMLQALELIKDITAPESFVKEVNRLAGTEVTVLPALASDVLAEGVTTDDLDDPNRLFAKLGALANAEDFSDLVDDVHRLINSDVTEFETQKGQSTIAEVEKLKPALQTLLFEQVASKNYVNAHIDKEGMTELARKTFKQLACACELIEQSD